VLPLQLENAGMVSLSTKSIMAFLTVPSATKASALSKQLPTSSRCDRIKYWNSYGFAGLSITILRWQVVRKSFEVSFGRLNLKIMPVLEGKTAVPEWAILSTVNVISA
jgi:hypothetical protein